MTLREEMARRLADTYAVGRRWDDLGAGHREDWCRVADEVLRQMEWARTRWVARVDNNGSTFYSEIAGSPLTLAPEGWSPGNQGSPPPSLDPSEKG
jgi:hypothetical protein